MAKILDTAGIALALFFGTVLFVYGGLAYLELMLLFFFLAILVTRYGYETKRDLGLYEHERGWENVLSNGLLPAALAVISPFVGPVPFIASVAAVTADKFGSEVGVLAADDPMSILEFKPIKPGTSGGISKLGTVASLAGASAIGFCAMFLFGISPNSALLISVFGFSGSIVDTILGVFEERGLGTKGTTNFFCSAAGALLGYLLIK